jgi:dTDP-4-dehydrorhamnose 3,5-epimerase
MKVTPLAIPEVLLLEPNVFGDDRGFFFESFNQKQFEAATGQTIHFVQDNHSRSSKNVLRGLHYQIKQPQGKLVRACSGAIYDVAVDIRQNAPSFGQWVGVELSADNKKQLWVPEGFAHGFVVLSDTAELLYKTTDFWAPEHEQCIAWNDETLNISWPIDATPQLSKKDLCGVNFRDAAVFKS